MTYQVTIRGKKSINIDSGSGAKILSELQDVNTTGRLDNYLLIWNATTQTYDHVAPSEILDRSDGIDNGVIDYGTF